MKSLKVLGIAALLVGGVVVPFSAASASIISNQTTATLMSGSSVTFSMGVTSDDHNVWISSQQGGTSGTGYVTKVNIDTSQAAIIQDPGFNVPWGLASTGTSVFVANSAGNTLSKIDVATSAVTTITNAAFATPKDVTWDGVHLWVGNKNGGVVELDSSGTVVRTITSPLLSVYDYGYGSSLSSDGTDLWVGSHAGSISDSQGCKGGCIVKIDIATGAVSAIRYTAPSQPPHPDTLYSNGHTVYFGDDNNDGFLWKLDIATSTVTHDPTTSVIGDAYSVTSDGSSVYFGQYDGCGANNLACVPVVDEATSALSWVTNTALQTLAGTNPGEVTWSRGCLWWAVAETTSAAGLLRICDSVAPVPTTTTTEVGPTTTQSSAGLASTGTNLAGLVVGSLLLIGVGVVGSRRRLRRRAS